MSAIDEQDCRISLGQAVGKTLAAWDLLFLPRITLRLTFTDGSYVLIYRPEFHYEAKDQE